MDTPSRQLVPSDPIDQRLQSLSEMFLASGSQYTLEEFSAAVQKHLPTLPDSRMALTNMMRFCEATVSKASLFNDVVKYPIIAEVLMTVFGSSQYFSDILVRDPELFRWLTATNVLLESPSRTDLEKKIARIEATFSHHVRRMDALKRFFRRETLRIGVRDLIGRCELQGTTHDLSLLADTIVEAALHVAEEEMKEKYQNPPSTEITVIGLGKLGGRELNYSSDIDILLVYGEEGELKGARAGTYHAYFNKLAERLIHHLTVHSAEGHFYRVDMRLRPESGAGPLTRSLHSYLLYYESRGELWERQMLIKARPIAGATELGEEFIRRLQPFVYPRTFFHHPAEEIARLKRRIEHTIAGEENIKLQAGGIRDIEFTVQALQLLHGGKTPAIRLQSTLDTISSLERHGLVAPEDARKMQRAYAFLRTIEHRLQIMMNTQTHTIPEDETALESLARNIGISSAGELRSVYAAHLQAVRKVYEEVMQVDASQEGSEILSLVEGNVSSEAVQGMLTHLGFQDPARAARLVRTLVHGSSLTGERTLDSRVQESLRDVAERLFSDISQSPSPDMTLANLAHVTASQAFPDQFYRQCKVDAYRKLVLTICSSSPRLAKGVARYPLLLETLAANRTTMQNSLLRGRLASGERMIEQKTQEELRLGVSYVLGLISFAELSQGLTSMAETIIREVWRSELRKHRIPISNLAIFALGKFGSGELNFDSDLDIIFVAEKGKTEEKAIMEKAAGGILRRLSQVTGQGRLFDVDARLRPEGKSAPLVIDRVAYASYLRNRASLWERQSLTRFRCVAGSKSLGQKVERDVEKFVFESPLPESWKEEIVTMRRKIETRSETRGGSFHDIKLGAGGMVDIEFLAQMIQLKLGGARQEFRRLRTMSAIEKASGIILNEKESVMLATTYQTYRTLETLMRLVLEETGTLLPEGERSDLLARCFDRSSSSVVDRMIEQTMKRVRIIFSSVTSHKL